MQTRFKMGQKVKVLTTGMVDLWHEAQFVGHQPATPTSAELYYFSNNSVSFPVTWLELPARVKLA